MQTTRVPEYKIYDVFHNCHDELVVITAGVNHLQLCMIDDNGYMSKFERYECGHGHSTVYVCPEVKKMAKVRLLLSAPETSYALTEVECVVNKYPSFDNEVIMSTVVKREDNYIVQWIRYHKLLGVTRFVIYDNVGNPNPVGPESIYPHTNLTEVLRNYIADGTVVLIKWDFNFKYQQTQQNHSIHAFSNAAYIGMFDIDEYVNPQHDVTDLRIILSHELTRRGLVRDQIGGIQLFCKIFCNPLRLPDDGYNFLKIYVCHPTSYHEKEKIFVIPRNVMTFSVHKITQGHPTVPLHDRDIFFNHYMYLNKIDRAREQTGILDTTIKRFADML